MFSKQFFSVSSCISVSVIYFSTFSSWILLKNHYFGNLRNSLSALRTGTGDSVMYQFWPNKWLCMTQTITSREELWLLTSKLSWVSHFILGDGLWMYPQHENNQLAWKLQSWCSLWSAFPAWSSFCEPCRSYCLPKKPFLLKTGWFVQQPAEGVKVTLNNTPLLLLLTEVFFEQIVISAV